MNTATLPEDLIHLRQFLPRIIARLEEKIPYVSALVTQEYGFALRLDRKQESMSETVPKRGIVFTLCNGRFFQEWATDRLDPEFLWSKANDMLRLWEQMPRQDALFTIDPGERLDAHFVSPFVIDPDEIDLEDVTAELHASINRIHALDSRLVSVQAHYSDGHEHKIFANRNRLLSSSLTTCAFRAVAVGTHNGSTHMNFCGQGGVMGFEAVRIPESALVGMVDDLRLLFESRPIDPGEYTVISSPEVSGILAHEAFGHGVEADMFAKERAKAASFLGKTIASEQIDMFDDPSLPGLMGSYYFDDEGMPARPTQIIRGGVLINALTDLRSATVLKLPRTSNGRRESFERKVYARMSNTYFQKGASSIESMIESVDDGLYLKKSSSGMEDPKGWGIQVGINLAQQIRNGRLTSKTFAPSTITGFVPDVLSSISMVGDTLEFMGDGGHCGKGHKEMVRVTAGGPALKFKARLG